MNSPCTRSINPDAALNQTGLFLSISLSDQGMSALLPCTDFTAAFTPFPSTTPPPPATLLIFSLCDAHQDPYLTAYPHSPTRQPVQLRLPSFPRSLSTAALLLQTRRLRPRARACSWLRSAQHPPCAPASFWFRIFRHSGCVKECCTICCTGHFRSLITFASLLRRQNLRECRLWTALRPTLPLHPAT